MAEQLPILESHLKKQEEVNQRLSKRLDALENRPPTSTQASANKPTMAQIVARPPAKKAKMSSIKELAKIIPTIRPKQPANSIKIVPPAGTKHPEKVIQKV